MEERSSQKGGFAACGWLRTRVELTGSGLAARANGTGVRELHRRTGERALLDFQLLPDIYSRGNYSTLRIHGVEGVRCKAAGRVRRGLARREIKEGAPRVCDSAKRLGDPDSRVRSPQTEHRTDTWSLVR